MPTAKIASPRPPSRWLGRVEKRVSMTTVNTPAMIGADCLSRLSDIDGLYTGDPRKRAELETILARHFRRSLAAGEGV